MVKNFFFLGNFYIFCLCFQWTKGLVHIFPRFGKVIHVGQRILGPSYSDLNDSLIVCLVACSYNVKSSKWSKNECLRCIVDKTANKSTYKGSSGIWRILCSTYHPMLPISFSTLDLLLLFSYLGVSKVIWAASAFRGNNSSSTTEAGENPKK